MTHIDRTVIRDLSLRCYVPPLEKPLPEDPLKKRGGGRSFPDERGYGRDMELVIDTETLPDLVQQLRFGIAHLHKNGSDPAHPARAWISMIHTLRQ